MVNESMVLDNGEHMSPNPKVGYAWSFLVAALWAFSGTFIKSCPLDPMTISGARGGIAMLIVVGIAAATRQRWSLRGCFEWPILLAGVAGGISCLAFVWSLNYITIGMSIVITYGSMQMIPWVERWVVQRQVTRADRVTAGIVLVGLLVIASEFGNERNLLGALWSVTCGLLYVVAIALRGLRPKLEVELQVSMYAWTLALSAPHFALAWDPRILTWESGWPLLGNGLTHGLVMFAMVRALRHLSATTVTFVTTSEILLSPLVALVILGEQPSFRTVVGGVVVLGAIVYHYKASRRQQ